MISREFAWEMVIIQDPAQSAQATDSTGIFAT
ncbi:hypothetical protein LVISKB_0231 [Levilactobacillus brevis KB290]|uniref:Uncharacterized protein n=1 Tax=Levilactobacillus brevis KB290 TaxID=1001583 RepID=M5AXS6_LEVBR|nr:hypothetical protein LVISKB_0231 [Levilactobacillus brevis KB290]